MRGNLRLRKFISLCLVIFLIITGNVRYLMASGQKDNTEGTQEATVDTSPDAMSELLHDKEQPDEKTPYSQTEKEQSDDKQTTDMKEPTEKEEEGDRKKAGEKEDAGDEKEAEKNKETEDEKEAEKNKETEDEKEAPVPGETTAIEDVTKKNDTADDQKVPDNKKAADSRAGQDPPAEPGTQDPETEHGDEAKLLIEDFYVREETIYTRENLRWYAAYDKKTGKTHVTFFISMSVENPEGYTAEIAADNGTYVTQSKAKRKKDSFVLDFDEEGIWTFTAIVTDPEGKSVTKKLTDPSSSGELSIAISNSRPEVEIKYDAVLHKEDGGTDKCIYYKKSNKPVSISVTDPSGSFSDQENRPKIELLKPDGAGEITPHTEISDTSFLSEYSLEQEGAYEFHISCRSKNGRPQKVTEKFKDGYVSSEEKDPYQSSRLLVDNTAPEVLEIILHEGENRRLPLEGKDQVFLNNMSKAEAYIEYTVKEDYPDASGIRIDSGSKKKNFRTELVRSEGNARRYRTFFNISDWSKEKEGEYSLVFGKISDKAGNAGIISDEAGKCLDLIRIIIDRTGPEIKVTFPLPENVMTDSERLSVNSNELFYKEHKNIRVELKEDNFISGISDREMDFKIRSKATDENDSYASLDAREIYFHNGEAADTWSCELTSLPDRECHSYFMVSCKDLSGNPASFIMDENDYGKLMDSDEENIGKIPVYISPVITIDRTPPHISTAFKDSPSGELNGRYFYRKPQTMTITVADENFDCRGEDHKFFSVKYSACDFNELTEDLEDQFFSPEWKTGVIWDQGTYKGGVKFYTATVRISEQWNYDIICKAFDLAGNRGKIVKDLITVDSTKPWISFQDLENTPRSDIQFLLPGEKERVSFFDYLRYGYFHNGGMQLKVSAHDDIAGLSKINYTVFHEDGSVTRGVFSFQDQSGRQTRYISIPANVREKVRLVPVDLGGIEGETADPRGSITETGQWHRDHSEIKIRINTKASGSAAGIDYYNKPVNATIIMKDDHSGIGSYRYSAGNSLSGEQNYSREAGSQDKKGKPEKEIIWSKNIHLELPAGDINYSGRTQPTSISALFYDHAGYRSEASMRFVIDDKKPVITVRWEDLSPAVNGSYYKSARTAFILVKERNFDEKRVIWKIKNMTGVQIGRWKHQGDNHSCRVSFTGEGDDFRLDFSLTDLAGNSSVCPAQTSFTVDKKAPVITITYDNNRAKNGNYYSKSRTAMIEVCEHTFRQENVKYKVTVTCEGKKESVSLPREWTGLGDYHRIKIKFDRDGEYALRFQCTDLAGNVSEKTVSDAFIIDRTPPEINITGVRDHKAYNDAVVPGVEYSDTNLDESSVSITLTGNRSCSSDSLKKTSERIHGGKRIKWEDFKRKPAMDDIYTLSVKVEDKAGNISSPLPVVFSVNRFGSNYYLSGSTKKLVNGGNPYISSPIPIEIKEVNVNKLVSSEVSVRNENNEIITLKEGPDYSIRETSNQYSWKEYTYLIREEIFSNEGSYSVTISSLDSASNRMTNVTKNKKIDFVVDQTRPYGRITGLEEKSYREKKHRISVWADDNYALARAVLYVNNTKIKTWSCQDFVPGAGVSVLLPERKTVQKVSLKVIDRAGNSRIILPDGNPYGSLITSDRFVQFYFNRFMIYGSVLILTALLAAATFLVNMKYRRQKSNLQIPEDYRPGTGRD